MAKFTTPILLSKAHLCAVHRALDHSEEAAGLSAEVEGFLKTNKETELLDACRR